MELVISYRKLSIKQIFQEHWDSYLSKNINLIPQYVIDTVEKMLACRNPNCGELSIFSRPGAFSAYFNPLFNMEWYVYESDELSPEDFTVSYVVRYTKKPPLAECKLHRYYCENDEYFVTFSYKERNKNIILWSMPAENFISRLIQHILEKGFRKVRYYGLLANRVRSYYLEIIAKLHKRMKRIITFFAWRKRQILFTGKDPLKCPICERTMKLCEIAYFSKTLNGLAYYYPP